MTASFIYRGSNKVSNIDICPHCSSPISPVARECPTCNESVGFPNVRYADRPEEKETLYRRYQKVRDEADRRGCLSQLDLFENALRSSKAVIAKNIQELSRIATSDNELFSTFYALVEGGIRLPEDNEFDFERNQADEALFPYYKNKIRFAALTLDECGVNSYGECSLIFKEDVIKRRATAFEMNSLLYYQKQIKKGTNKIEKGVRSLWDERHLLCIAKLGSKIQQTSSGKDYPGYLMNQGSDYRTTDFVEVHIYGSISRHSFEKVILTNPGNPKRRARIVELKDIRKRLKDIGIIVEER